MSSPRPILLVLAGLALSVLLTTALYLAEYQPPPRQAIAEPAVIVTLSPELDSQYFGPEAEQGEGGPDVVRPEPWAIPASDCGDVRELIAGRVDDASAQRLVWIANQESDCGAQRVNRASQDYGIWQVNWPTWAGPLCKRAGLCLTPWLLAHDDELQLAAVLQILEWRGWSAWCWATDDHLARGIGYDCPW